jgi:diguanylate cyclase (GGDEF)-like protein
LLSTSDHLASNASDPDVADAISHLVSLTAQRDRDLLDVSLAQAVLDLLGVNMVGVYRLIGREEEERRWLCSGLARRGKITVSDPPWVDLASLPLFDEFPLRKSVLGSKVMDQGEVPVGQSVEGQPRFVTAMPLITEVGMPGVLEVWSDQPLSTVALRPIQTLLKVFGNFQNLLEASQRDTLTGLLNRQTFDAAFLKASMPPAADGRPSMAGERRTQPVTGYWLGVIDIDHFKRVNDGYGHLIGDEVLVLVARIMRQSFRHYDRLYRFGGEEFVVLLRGGTEADAARAFDRFRENVALYPFPQIHQVTVSIGFTEVQHKDTHPHRRRRAVLAPGQAPRASSLLACTFGGGATGLPFSLASYLLNQPLGRGFHHGIACERFFAGHVVHHDRVGVVAAQHHVLSLRQIVRASQPRGVQGAIGQ